MLYNQKLQNVEFNHTVLAARSKQIIICVRVIILYEQSAGHEKHDSSSIGLWLRGKGRQIGH
jgi:hypothetical protein